MIALVLLLGCPKMVVRDAQTYQAEVAWNQAATSQAAEQLRVEALVHQLDGDQRRCLELAETALVLGVRAPWHARMSLYLADLGEDPGDPPVVPEASTLCPEAK